MVRVIEQCRALDRLAVVLYEGFEANTRDPEQRLFWRSMAAEERRHVAFWDDLLDEYLQGAVPDVVLDPEGALVRLRVAYQRAESFSRTIEPYSPPPDRFLIALRLEFHMLDPVFEQLFRFGHENLGLDDIPASYEGHVRGVVEAMERFGGSTPALEAVAEMLLAHWERSRAVAEGTLVDELTGLMSRRSMLHSMLTLAHVARRKGFSLGVVVVSLDKLGQLNEQRGFEAGDGLLRGMGAVLLEARRGQDLVGRWASDMVVAVLPDTYHDDLFRSAQVFQQAVGRLTGKLDPPCCSIGVASTRIGDDVEASVQRLMAEAERKMLLAKDAGGGRIVG